MPAPLSSTERKRKLKTQWEKITSRKGEPPNFYVHKLSHSTTTLDAKAASQFDWETRLLATARGRRTLAMLPAAASNNTPQRFNTQCLMLGTQLPWGCKQLKCTLSVECTNQHWLRALPPRSLWSSLSMEELFGLIGISNNRSWGMVIALPSVFQVGWRSPCWSCWMTQWI